MNAQILCRGHKHTFGTEGNYGERIGSPIITTGNELVKQQIADFSKMLDLEELYRYSTAVKESTDENAYWLIDYWCGKDFRGLIQMPFSRHWIMHIEASLRIKNKLHPSTAR